MIIHKIINNNIVSSLDENHNEIILMGRGIAYQKSRGEVVPDEMIEKQFYLKNDFKETDVFYAWQGEDYVILSRNGIVQKKEFWNFWDSLKKEKK